MPTINKRREDEAEWLEAPLAWLNNHGCEKRLHNQWLWTAFVSRNYRAKGDAPPAYDPASIPGDARWIQQTLSRWLPDPRKPATNPELVYAVDRVGERLMAADKKELWLGKLLTGEWVREEPKRLLVSFLHDRVAFREAYAVHLFLRVYTANAARDHIARCKLRSCRRYFVNKSGQQEYCCAAHRQQTNNRKSNPRRDQRRKHQLAATLQAARVAVRKWRPAKGDWKRWVARRIGKGPKFVTRHVNAGRLTPPKGVAA